MLYGGVVLDLILSLDPGKTLGYVLAQQVEDGAEILRIGTISGYEEGLRFVRALPRIDVIVVEDYVVRPVRMSGRNPNNWSREETLKQLARIEEIAATKESKIVHQQPSCKPAGYGWAGLKYVPGKAGTHWQDALAHLMYYMVTKLKLAPGSIRRSPEATVLESP